MQAGKPGEELASQYPRQCNQCKQKELELPVSLRPCNRCRDVFYCSDYCRNTDAEAHSCRRTISTQTSYSRNSYLLRSQQQNAGDTIYNISKLTDQRRDQLLSAAMQRATNSIGRVQAVLEKLKEWNPEIAKRFYVKSVPFSGSALRMIYSNWEIVPKDGQQPEQSFVALSYSWRTTEWKPVADAYYPLDSDSPVPICKFLWDFLLSLLEAGEEGIWIDQLCLDQNDVLEKTSAIASMDDLYASARLVFVALEDISLTYDEVSTLNDGINQVADQHDLAYSTTDARKIFAIVSKIFHARWFSRAWCFHEYHLSKNRILAIPCATSPSGVVDSAVGIVNFGELIFRLAYFQNETIQRENEELVQKLMAFFGGQDYAYSNIISNTFSYHSRQPEDKLTIALNICQLGVAIELKDLSLDEAWIYLLILALAAGDATILTTRGPKMEYGEYSERTSWLNRPDETCWSTRHDYPLPSGITSLSARHVNLDLFVINQAVCRRPGTWAMRRAKIFLQTKLADQIRVAYGLQDVGSQYVVERSVAETLASILDCGLEWMIGAWHRIQGEVAAEVEQSYQSVRKIGRACVRSLVSGSPVKPMRTKMNKPSARIAFKWRNLRSEKVGRPVQQRKRINTRAKVRSAQQTFWASAYRMLLCVMLFGKYWEMAMIVKLPRTLAITDLHSSGNNFDVPAPSEHKIYSGVRYESFPKASVVLAVPRVLAHRKFGLSDRLWLLKSTEDEDSSICWQVCEKVGLVGCRNIVQDRRTVFLLKNQRIIG